MNNLFTRVYGGLLITVIAVGILCLILFRGLNTVRYEHHNVLVSSPLFNYLAEAVTADNHPLVFNMILPSGSHIGLVDINTLEISPRYADRLAWGQVVVSHDTAGSHVFRKIDRQFALVGFFPNLYADVAQTTLNLVTYELSNTAPGAIPQKSAQLSSALGINIELVSDFADLTDQAVLDELADYGVAALGESENDISYWLLRLDNGQILKVEFLPGFDPFSWPVALVLLLTLGGVLAMTVYFLLETISEKLRGLETVASRIARGELDARVRTDKVDALGRLGNAFNSMADHIQRLVLVQREMIHAVSHELRTPVARIRFGVQMIEDCPDEKSMQKQLHGIDNDIQELDELIDEILTYARLEEGGPILDLQESDVVDIVNQVVLEQGSVRPDLKVVASIVGESEKWRLSEIEPRYIHRAIQNLVGNATRYCQTQVLVRCSIDKDTCRIDVEDDGQGIPETDWEKVFTPFARLDDSRTRKSGGYGLGLSIVRRILYWHGGQAFLGKSTAGGAKFSLVWPRRQNR